MPDVGNYTRLSLRLSINTDNNDIHSLYLNKYNGLRVNKQYYLRTTAFSGFVAEDISFDKLMIESYVKHKGDKTKITEDITNEGLKRCGISFTVQQLCDSLNGATIQITRVAQENKVEEEEPKKPSPLTGMVM